MKRKPASSQSPRVRSDTNERAPKLPSDILMGKLGELTRSKRGGLIRNVRIDKLDADIVRTVIVDARSLYPNWRFNWIDNYNGTFDFEVIRK